MSTTCESVQLTGCTDCRACSQCCTLLSSSGETPGEMAQRGISLAEAFSCSLCEACSALCPEGIAPHHLFAARRTAAIAAGEFDINSLRYLFPDLPNNVMSLYRQQYGIDYQDLAPTEQTGSCFFPGCTMLTYAPALTRAIFQHLQQTADCGGIWADCCGRLLEQLGMPERLQQCQHGLLSFAEQHGITRIITACPGCYYDLHRLFDGTGCEVVTVYELLDLPAPSPGTARCVTVHDACPDRHQGIFGRQVRAALQHQGYQIIEMTHTGSSTICCGSGGQLSHHRPDLVEELIETRKQEFLQTGAADMLGYCLSCVLKYESMSDSLPVSHVLNLLLEVAPDHRGAKQRSLAMFAGQEGQQRWDELMAD